MIGWSRIRPHVLPGEGLWQADAGVGDLAAPLPRLPRLLLQVHHHRQGHRHPPQTLPGETMSPGGIFFPKILFSFLNSTSFILAPEVHHGVGVLLAGPRLGHGPAIGQIVEVGRDVGEERPPQWALLLTITLHAGPGASDLCRVKH